MRVCCRVGSSEKRHRVWPLLVKVCCRVGSSEITYQLNEAMGIVCCRVGSSESRQELSQDDLVVCCRVGSSEIVLLVMIRTCPVCCRVGSSENRAALVARWADVCCRVGSSEMPRARGGVSLASSLPCRRLRNPACPRWAAARSLLPCRQLRKVRSGIAGQSPSSLLRRQIEERRCTDAVVPILRSTTLTSLLWRSGPQGVRLRRRLPRAFGLKTPYVT